MHFDRIANRGMVFGFTALLMLGECVTSHSALAAEPKLSSKQAEQALRKSVSFFRAKVGYRGAYLFRYSSDLSRQEGEHDAFRTTGWLDPPGTPAVGAGYLDAYLRIGEPYLLDAAKEVANALQEGQLKSGGWFYKFELDPQHRKRYAYRRSSNPKADRNRTTLDDNKTQSALMFLMHLDEVTEHPDQKLGESIRYGLDQLLGAQFPNGSWPQQFSGPPKPEEFPVVRASYPASWPKSFPKTDYREHYTFNDNAISDTIEVMLEAARIYDEPKYRAAA